MKDGMENKRLFYGYQKFNKGLL